MGTPYQLLDVVDVYRSTPDGECAQQVYMHVGKTLDGRVVVRPAPEVRHEVFLAVGDGYELGQAEQVASLLNGHLLANQHECKRFRCTKCTKRRGGKEFTICTEPCKLDRQTDRAAVAGVSIYHAKSFYGYQPTETKFVKFELTRSYYASSVLRTFLEKKHLDLPISKGGGVYELTPNAVDSYLNQQRNHSVFDWFDEDTGRPVPPELSPPPTVDAPLKAIFFDIETPSTNPDRVPEPEDGVPVVSIAYLTYPENKMVCLTIQGAQTAQVVRHPDMPVECTIQVFETETILLRRFYRDVMQYDPDRIIGYNSNSFDFPYIMTRMKMLNMPEHDQWSRVAGEPVRFLKTQSHSEQKGTRSKTIIHCPGRIFFDVYVAVVNDNTIKCASKKLGKVSAWLELGEKVDLHPTELYEYFHGTAEQRGKFIYYNLMDVLLTRDIAVKKMMLSHQVGFCKVFKILPRDQLDRGISYAISRLVYSRTYGKYLRPTIGYVNKFDEKTQQDVSVRDVPYIMRMVAKEMELRGVGFEGATVLEPMPAVYRKWVGTLDFRSLYPSIIQRHNICLSTWIPTVERAAELGLVKDVDYDVAPNGAMFMRREKGVGFIPELACFLVNERTKIRAQIKRETVESVRNSLDSIANAYKIGANSVYGQFGMGASALSLMLAGDGVTSYGRSYIHRVIAYIESCEELKSFNPRVRYGDTDSCMVHFDAPEGIEQARERLVIMQKAVNEHSGILQPPMEMGCDSLNEMFAITKKKRYLFGQVSMVPGASAVVYPVVKGLEFVKGDSVPYSGVVAEELTTGVTTLNWSREETFEFMRGVIRKIILGQVPDAMFVMTTKLSKPLDAYGGSPGNHVIAARQLVKAGTKVEPGDAIEYYFCHCPQANTSKRSSYIVAKQLFVPGTHKLHYDMYLERFLSPFVDLLEILLGSSALEEILSFDPRFHTIAAMFGARPKIKEHNYVPRPSKRVKVDPSKHFDLQGFLRKASESSSAAAAPAATLENNEQK